MKDLAVALPPTPVTAQPDSHTQVSCSTIGQSSISQQAWQVGNGSSSTNQAQIYLHAQMLILTPDLPVFSSILPVPPPDRRKMRPSRPAILLHRVFTPRPLHTPGYSRALQSPPSNQTHPRKDCALQSSHTP
ncbi:hypothetical protein COCON_G00063420 [Conger conger]|uniref:Uncharacterized protein n=1 Tax=Conger conger TaxID=82655 RepID=A0A9Q1I3N6_CONCO|nr:hypothetical protein COCON_G00063420 [Conger conger]